MRLDLFEHQLVVTLSKRNLLALLCKVDNPLSMQILTSGCVYRDGALVDDTKLIVCCEPDASHYAGRESPGQMQLATEFFIARATGEDGSRN